ncbi:hypothetical protein QBC41DRAFT_50157 [Cercophora samala]|uniref:Uncharacterized protein n=1 Tax=Cercophora samala TaxID=330535 RepID=A0AA39YWX5_9PEZI|nr:hypothetical protein QBC41DRAFT_50157 [Cercophora samala]
MASQNFPQCAATDVATEAPSPTTGASPVRTTTEPKPDPHRESRLGNVLIRHGKYAVFPLDDVAQMEFERIREKIQSFSRGGFFAFKLARDYVERCDVFSTTGYRLMERREVGLIHRKVIVRSFNAVVLCVAPHPDDHKVQDKIVHKIRSTHILEGNCNFEIIFTNRTSEWGWGFLRRPEEEVRAELLAQPPATIEERLQESPLRSAAEACISLL